MLNTPDGPRRQKRWQVASILAAATLLTGQMCAASAPQLEPVSLYLNVEMNGGLITGLAQGHFRLFLDGKPHPFRLAKPEEPASIKNRGPRKLPAQPAKWGF